MSRLAVLTGGTGFLGRHVAAALAARGWRLRLLVRRAPDLPELAGTPIELVPGALAEPAALARLVEGADLVVHAAGLVKAADPADFRRANADGTEALARAWAEGAPGARLLMVSSMAARRPELSPYAASKREAEARLAARAPAGADLRVLRPAAIHGPHDAESLKVLKLADAPFQPMLNAAGARVAMIAARDAAEAIAALAEAPGRGETHELTDMRREGYTWRELAETAALALGRRPRPVRLPAAVLRAAGALGGFVAARTGRADILSPGKAREILWPDWGADPALPPVPADLWAPRIGLAAGLAETVAWARAAGRLGGGDGRG